MIHFTPIYDTQLLPRIKDSIWFPKYDDVMNDLSIAAAEAEYENSLQAFLLKSEMQAGIGM